MGLLDRLTDRVGGIFEDFLEEVMIPDQIHRRLQRAARAYDAEDYDEALEILGRVEDLHPNLARVHHLKGLCHFHRGAPQEAARAFRRAIELKEGPTHHLWAGLAMEQLEEWRAAQDHFQRAINIEADASFEFDLTFGLGRVHLRQGRADKAIKELRKAMRLRDAQPDAALILAEALLQRGEVEEAHAALEHLGEENLEGTHALLVSARIHRERGDARRAFGAYAAAANADGQPQEVLEARLGAARMALALEELDEARAYLDQATGAARGEPRADLYVLKGLVAEADDDLREAARCFEVALQQDPTHGDALRGSGRMMLAGEAHEAALDLFRRSLDATRGKDTEASLLGQGRARLEMGDLSGARQVLEEAAKIRSSERRPPSPHVLTALGEVSLKSGDFAEAVVALQDAAAHADAPDLAATIDDLTQTALGELTPQWDLPDEVTGPMELERLLEALQDYIASDARLVDFMPSTQKILRAMNTPLSMAIVGEFNAGKSTLINALIGEDIVPMGVLPTTAHTGILQYGPRQVARVVWRGERDAVEVDFDEAKRLMKDDASEIDHLQYWVPHPGLRAVHYWDTPGFNALEERHEEVASRALEEAEAILWVLDANQVLSQTEFALIEEIPAGDERLLVVINKIDRLGEEDEREEAVAHLIEYVEEHAGEHIAGCFPISALHALRRLDEDDADEAAPAEDGFEEFRRHLDSRIIKRAGRIKTIEGKRHVARLVLTLAAFQHGLIRRYKSLGGKAEEAGDWVEGIWATHPSEIAERELIEAEERVGFLLRVLVREIEEALKPRPSLVRQRMVLSEEDRDYLIDLLTERFEGILADSKDRVFNDIVGLEAELAEFMNPILEGLSLQDARGLNRRLQGFQDEVRVLKLLLEERVFGQIIARARGQIGAAATSALTEIENSEDQTRWRGLLRELLPSLREDFEANIAEWYDTFFVTASRFCDRVRRDLSLLELEARHRYDISPLEARLEEDAHLDAPPPEKLPDPA